MSAPSQAGVDTKERMEVTRRGRHSDRRNLAVRSLLAASRRLVARRGVDQTSVADIGEEAGYSRGLVNHRFGSKAALFKALAQDSQQALEAIFLDTDEDNLESLVTFVGTYLRWIEDRAVDARAFFAMWGAAVPEESVLQSVFVGFDDHFRRKVEGIVTTGQGNGTISSDADPVGFAIVYMAMLRGIGVQAMVSPGRVDLVAARLVCEQSIRRTLTAWPGQ